MTDAVSLPSGEPGAGDQLRWPKTTRLGRTMAAIHRLRSVPRNAVRAELAARRDARTGATPARPARPRRVRTVVCIPAGPGEAEALFDTIDSVMRSDGPSTQIVVIDDSTVDVREAVVRGRFPDVVVLRKRFGSGGSPNVWRQCRMGLRYALESHDFELWVKMDTDALVTGPRFSEAILSRFEQADDSFGAGGTTGVGADGARLEGGYHRQVLSREIGRQPLLEDAYRRAASSGWDGESNLHGGIMCLTARACRAIAEHGWLSWRRPWDSLLAQDYVLSMFVLASGFRLLSLGDPGGLLAIGNKELPLPKEEIAEGSWVGAHSVRRGTGGEGEAELRAFFRKARARWPAVPA